jgi:hypothetical protein
LEEYLQRYNDEFPDEEPLRSRFTQAISLVCTENLIRID